MKKWNVECVSDWQDWFDGEVPSCGVSMFVDDDYVEAETAEEAIELTIDWLINETIAQGHEAEIVNDDLQIVRTKLTYNDQAGYHHSWRAKEVEE